jgi:hypothetical protein
MKKPILPFLIFVLFGLSSFAQYQSPYTGVVDPKEIALPKVYLSVGSGLQYKYGILGLGFGYRVAPTAIVEFNTGLGLYGSKVGLTGIFKSGYKNGWCPSIGFSKANGFQDLILDVEVSFNEKDYEVNTSINLDPLLTINAGLQRQFMTKRGNRFTIDLGYAIGLNKQIITFNEKSVLIEGKYIATENVDFSANQKSFFQTLGPSGLTLGLSYNFGFFGL